MTEDGEQRWSSEGVTVWKWDRKYKHILKPHRLAVLPKPGVECNFRALRPDRFYVHVYQTKIEFKRYNLRTLKSRIIAKELAKRWAKSYLPRSIDTDEKRLSSPSNRTELQKRVKYGTLRKSVKLGTLSDRERNPKMISRNSRAKQPQRENGFKNRSPNHKETFQIQGNGIPHW